MLKKKKEGTLLCTAGQREDTAVGPLQRRRRYNGDLDASTLLENG